MRLNPFAAVAFCLAASAVIAVYFVQLLVVGQ